MINKERYLNFKTALKELQDILDEQKMNNLHLSQKYQISGSTRKEELRFGEHTEFMKQFNNNYKRKTNVDIAHKDAFQKTLMKRIKMVNKLFRFIEKYSKKGNYSVAGINYLMGKDRKLKARSILNSRIIVIKDANKLLNHIRQKYSLDELISSGFMNKKGQFIFYNYPILIPYIKDGKVVYCRGRKLPNTNIRSKYMGLSGHSSKQIFNVDILKKMKPNDKLLLCEGEFDTLIAQQAGYNAIGFGGVTNIPYDKLIELGISKYELCVIFDNDPAGDKMAQEIANKLGVNVKKYKLLYGKDITVVYNGK